MHQDHDLFARSPDALAAEVGGEIVALNVEKGLCYGLNEIASRVWDLLDQPRSLGEICQALVQSYDVDDDTCRQEVATLLQDLLAEELVRKVPA